MSVSRRDIGASDNISYEVMHLLGALVTSTSMELKVIDSLILLENTSMVEGKEYIPIGT